MSELLRELQEDMKRERQAQFLKRYGKLALLLSAILVLVTIGWVGSKHYAQKKHEEATRELLAAVALVETDPAKAAQQFEAMAAREKGGIRAIALLRAAQSWRLSGNKEAEQKAYAQLASDEDALAPLASIRTGEGRGVHKTEPFYYAHQEMLGWRKLDEGKRDEALALWKPLVEDNAAPQPIRSRLTEVIAHFSTSVTEPK